MNNKGFTLVEILIVTSIVTSLATIAISNTQRVWLQAQESKTIAELNSIYKAITMYELDNGIYPNDWEDLRLYINVDKLKDDYELNQNL